MSKTPTNQRLSVGDCELKNKRVLIRCDFNIPPHQEVLNNRHIVEALPTIRYVIEQGARSVNILSHHGRPQGKRLPENSLGPIALELERLLERSVKFVEASIGSPELLKVVNQAHDTEVLLLENLRFYPEEEALENDSTPGEVESFRRNLAALGDVYISEAFGAAHRVHTSMLGLGLYQQAMGLRFETEMQQLSSVLQTPRRPCLVMLGGQRSTDRNVVVANLIEKGVADAILIRGPMALSYRKEASATNSLLAKAAAKGIDIVAADTAIAENGLNGHSRTKEREGVPAIIQKRFEWAQTIMWDDLPSDEDYKCSTKLILEAAVLACGNGKTVVVNNYAALEARRHGLHGKLTFVSSGFKATVALLEGNRLPGVEALSLKG